MNPDFRSPPSGSGKPVFRVTLGNQRPTGESENLESSGDSGNPQYCGFPGGVRVIPGTRRTTDDTGNTEFRVTHGTRSSA